MTDFDMGILNTWAVEKPVESVNNFLNIEGNPQLWKPCFVNLMSKE